MIFLCFLSSIKSLSLYYQYVILTINAYCSLLDYSDLTSITVWLRVGTGWKSMQVAGSNRANQNQEISPVLSVHDPALNNNEDTIKRII